MRDPLAIKAAREHQFDRDAQESAFLRGVQNEVFDREQAEAWKSIPNAKLPPKKSSDAESHTTLAKVLADFGLASLNDLVALNDMMEMKAAEQVPDGHDQALRAKLRDALHELSPKRDITSSYQYLAGEKTVSAGDGDVWQVQMSRRRRHKHETRMSRDHHEDLLEDALGNEIGPMIEAAKRVATAKEIKRIRKVVAARRRAGEEVFTDEELESANLAPPPDMQTGAKSSKKKVGSPKPDAPDWMSLQMAYLDPPHAYLDPPSDGTQTPSPYASNDSSGSWVDIGGRIGGGTIIARVPSGSWC